MFPMKVGEVGDAKSAGVAEVEALGKFEGRDDLSGEVLCFDGFVKAVESCVSVIRFLVPTIFNSQLVTDRVHGFLCSEIHRVVLAET